MTAKRCAYLTMDCDADWCIDADLAFPPMRALGWHIDAVRWRDAAEDWDGYHAVYIGTPWDYPGDPERFLALLELIDASDAVLVNDLDLVRWNLSKTYLRDLERRGVAVVPSRWHDRMTIASLETACDAFGAERIIVKPVVGTNAKDTFLLTRDGLPSMLMQLLDTFAGRAFLVQPFIAGILDEGELSLFYFNAVYSHAIRKAPKAGEFRVQEEHGATITAIEPSQELRAAGARVLALVNPVPAYARVDFVRGADGRFLVMELELIEPSMYLRMHPDAPRRFAAAFNQYVENARAREGSK